MRLICVKLTFSNHTDFQIPEVGKYQHPKG